MHFGLWLRRRSPLFMALLSVALLPGWPAPAAPAAAQAPSAAGSQGQSRVYAPLVSTPPPLLVVSSQPSSIYNGPLHISAPIGMPTGEAVLRTTLPVTVYDVLVEMRMFNAAGDLLETVTGTLDLPAVFPGQNATVGLPFSWAASGGVAVTTDVLSWTLAAPPGVVAPLTVVSVVEVQRGSRGYVIYEATLENTTPWPMSEGWFVVRGDQGAERRWATVPPLAPGARAAIRFGQWGLCCGHRAAAQGRYNPAP